MAANYSFVVAISYFILYVFMILIVSIVCAFTVRLEYMDAKNELDQDVKWSDWSATELFRRWIKLLWRQKKVYGHIIPHFFDQATDLGVIFEYYKLRNDDINIDTMNLFVISICVLVFHRIISSAAIYHLTKKPIYMVYQLFDLLMVKCIWTNYKLGSDEPSNSQRYLQIMEATFESAPQILISTAFLVKSSISSANNPIIIISLITSFWSVSARVSGDDKLMFKDEWKSLECSSRFPFVNCRYIIRVLWRFLEISSRIILLCLMWIDLGGLSVFIVLTAELIYLSVICFGLQSIGVMGNIIYLVAAYSNKKSEQWAISMTRLYWSYRVLSSYLYLMLVTVFAMGKFDEPKINDHRTRHAQTIENKVGLAIFVYCWIVTPIWQWIGAVIVFDYGNISSVGRDLDQLLEDGKLLDVLELISFGAKFNATTLTEVIHILKKPNSSYNHTVCDQIVDMCLVQLQQQQKVKDLLFNAAYDGNSEIVECVLNATDLTANVQDDQKRTPLFYAAAQQHNELVATLLMVYSASCSILIDDHASEQPMNILQYKLANTEFPCDEDDDLAIIRMLVELGKVEIDINTYNLAKTSHHSSAVLEYLNDLGDLKQDECEHIQHDITVLKKCKMKPKQLAKAKWTKDRDRRETFKMEGNQTHAEAKWIMQKQPDVFYHDDRPILDCTLKICRYLRVINFIILIAAIFGSDIAALVINSAHDCNGALLNGSAFVSFDVNDFILGGSITHLVVLVLILCGNGMCGNEIMA
eukprot:934663_1